VKMEFTGIPRIGARGDIGTTLAVARRYCAPAPLTLPSGRDQGCAHTKTVTGTYMGLVASPEFVLNE